MYDGPAFGAGFVAGPGQGCFWPTPSPYPYLGPDPHELPRLRRCVESLGRDVRGIGNEMHMMHCRMSDMHHQLNRRRRRPYDRNRLRFGGRNHNAMMPPLWTYEDDDDDDDDDNSQLWPVLRL